ncbi:diaminobutyrate--2-oxoglutarate transaminase [Methylocystis heyeri]|nr:diaminobutyrate--2-oxoglutarate transaminase [Methylocystis heyeri]
MQQVNVFHSPAPINREQASSAEACGGMVGNGAAAPSAAGVSSRVAYLERQATIESNARAYPRRLPIVIASGRGVVVRDVDGRDYIDCLAGAGALALGHSHPAVIQAIRQALDDGAPLQTLDLPTPLKDEFTRTLFESLPAAFAEDYKIHFCGPTGADAVEAALKLVKTATGRKGVLAFHGAYHGMTQGAMSVTGDTAPKIPAEGRAADVQFLPFPSEYRCPFGMGAQASAEISARSLEAALEDPSCGLLPPAALIMEIVQGEGGVNPAPDDWLRKVREITARHGVLLIVDEVQTGLGRTGRLYAFEQPDILPDVVILSKAIGGGLPLSVILYRRELDVWRPGAHAGTFRGNQLAFAAGAAAIRFVMSNHLERHAQAAGARLQSLLTGIAAETSCIGHVRGRGLMRGVEIHDPRSVGAAAGVGVVPSASAIARRVQEECLRRGLIVELGGRHGVVVRFLPPLVATLAEIDEIAQRFGEAVKAVEASRVSQ